MAAKKVAALPKFLVMQVDRYNDGNYTYAYQTLEAAQNKAAKMVRDRYESVVIFEVGKTYIAKAVPIEWTEVTKAAS